MALSKLGGWDDPGRPGILLLGLFGWKKNQSGEYTPKEDLFISTATLPARPIHQIPFTAQFKSSNGEKGKKKQGCGAYLEIIASLCCQVHCWFKHNGSPKDNKKHWQGKKHAFTMHLISVFGLLWLAVTSRKRPHRRSLKKVECTSNTPQWRWHNQGDIVEDNASMFPT